MPRIPALLTLRQFSALTGVSLRALRRVLKEAPKGVVLQEERGLRVRHPEFIRWLTRVREISKRQIERRAEKPHQRT